MKAAKDLPHMRQIFSVIRSKRPFDDLSTVSPVLSFWLDATKLVKREENSRERKEKNYKPFFFTTAKMRSQFLRE